MQCRFECRSDGDYFVIEHVAFARNTDSIDDDSEYEGPVRVSLHVLASTTCVLASIAH